MSKTHRRDLTSRRIDPQFLNMLSESEAIFAAAIRRENASGTIGARKVAESLRFGYSPLQNAYRVSVVSRG
jgi:hypothetical protein